MSGNCQSCGEVVGHPGFAIDLRTGKMKLSMIVDIKEKMKLSMIVDSKEKMK